MYSFIKLLFLSSLSLVILACGGASGATGSVNASLGVETQKSQLNSNKNRLNIDFILKNDYGQSVEVELSDLTIDITPCSVQSVNYTPNEIHFQKGTTEVAVSASVNFVDSCTPTGYQLKARIF